MTLAVAARHRLGDFVLDAQFESAGRVTALVGVSGSGKTTVINAIAGLITPEQGQIVVNDATLFDSAAGIDVPVHRRSLGYVFQEARLFPHLNVEQNLLYGRRFAPKSRRFGDLAAVSELLGISPLLKRSPQQLSGGEKQRVAIGRALLASPRLLLMDEPMAALDDERKAEILPYIERLRDVSGVPIVYVSHAVAEVSRLADHVVLMDAGRVVESGPAADVLQHFASLPAGQRREAGSLLAMTVAGYDPTYDMTKLTSAAGEAFVPGRIGKEGDPVRLRIRAHDVIVATAEPKAISALNIFHGTIAGIEGGAPLAVKIDSHGKTIVAAVTRQSCEQLGLRPGMDVYAIVKALAVEGVGGD